MSLVERITKNLWTTIGGIVAGALSGAGMAYQSGSVDRNALITGAAVGAIGVMMKDPKWLKRANHG